VLELWPSLLYRRTQNNVCLERVEITTLARIFFHPDYVNRRVPALASVDDDIDRITHLHFILSWELGVQDQCIPHSMQKSFMRIPYTGPLPPPIIIPRNANTPSGAVAALSAFLAAPPRSPKPAGHDHEPSTVLLTGAGISVASGLADYRGTNGTYTLNKTYRPIYYHEFITNHEARKRYWARSFLGWTNLFKAKPNNAHWAVKRLGEMGVLKSVITQSTWIAIGGRLADLAGS